MQDDGSDEWRQAAISLETKASLKDQPRGVQLEYRVRAAAIEKFGEAVIIAAHITLLKEVKRKSGLDYLQVFEVDGEKLWFIDDVTHVTALLPSDY